MQWLLKQHADLCQRSRLLAGAGNERAHGFLQLGGQLSKATSRGSSGDLLQNARSSGALPSALQRSSADSTGLARASEESVNQQHAHEEGLEQDSGRNALGDVCELTPCISARCAAAG